MGVSPLLASMANQSIIRLNGIDSIQVVERRGASWSVVERRGASLLLLQDVPARLQERAAG